MPYGRYNDVLPGDTVTWQDPSGARRAGTIITVTKNAVTLVIDNQVIFTVSREKFEARQPVVVRRPYDPAKSEHPAAAFAAQEAEKGDEVTPRRRSKSA
jgi:hypothetical protein